MNMSVRKFNPDDKLSTDYDDKNHMKINQKYENSTGEYFSKRSIVSMNEGNKRRNARIKQLKEHRIMANTSTERFRRNLHFRDSSVPISHGISSSRAEKQKLQEENSDFLTVHKNRNTSRQLASLDKIKLGINDNPSIQSLRQHLHMHHRVGSKKVKKINAKLLNIFKDPELSDEAIESARRRSQENMNSLYNIQIKKNCPKIK